MPGVPSLMLINLKGDDIDDANLSKDDILKYIKGEEDYHMGRAE